MSWWQIPLVGAVAVGLLFDLFVLVVWFTDRPISNYCGVGDCPASLDPFHRHDPVNRHNRQPAGLRRRALRRLMGWCVPDHALRLPGGTTASARKESRR